MDIEALHRSGMTQREMAQSLEISVSSVRRKMKQLGLHGNSNGTRDFQIASGAFDDLTREDSAYWLGFLLADGCIAKSGGTFRALRLSLQDRDEEYLTKFAEFINYRGKIYHSVADGHSRKIIVFNDKPLTSRLIDCGWFDFKRGIGFDILRLIPAASFHHFIRGYFDGDGCISSQARKHRFKRRWYANIVCKYENMLELMRDLMISHGGPHSEVRKRSACYDLRWSNVNRLKAFYEFAYKDATVYLERKFLKFQQAVQTSDFSWQSIASFALPNDPNDQLKEAFLKNILQSGWANPRYDVEEDYQACEAINLSNYMIQNVGIKTGLAPGNKLIANYQPIIYRIRQNGSPSISELVKHPKTVQRALKAFFVPDKPLTPARLIRELRFAGFTMASLLSVPVIMAALEWFNLKGVWFDPCAGWGNRLLAAHLRGLDYVGIDPGVSFPGLVRLREHLKQHSFKLHNVKYQEYEWGRSDFILTSTPFHNKENYLDNINYGTFSNWCTSFFQPLVEKCLANSDRVVLHCDNAMTSFLENNYSVSKCPLLSPNRKKAPLEYFVEVLKKDSRP